MQVGELYENRNGKYRVQSIKQGVATIQYEDSAGTASGSVDILEKIHRNIVNERELAEPRAEEAKFMEVLRKQGCVVKLQVHPRTFPKFVREYAQVTGVTLTEDLNDISIADHYWEKVVALKVVFNRKLKAPKHLKPHPKGDQMEVGNTRFGWELIREGFRIGVNTGVK